MTLPLLRWFALAAPLVPLALPAQVTFHHDDGKALVAAAPAIERVATGRQFLEGPVWLPSERQLVCSDIPAKQWLRFDPAAPREQALSVWQASAGANGNTLDRQGRLLSCQHEARDLVRHEVDGTRTVLVDRHDGKRLNSPNDLAVRYDDSIWFTDPTYGLGKRDREQPGNFVYRLEPSTGATTVVQRDFEQPNGLCFAPDHQRLYLADSGSKQRVGAFPVTAAGTLGEPSFWLQGGSDGMRCDAAGNLWTTARDGVRCYSAAGVQLLTIELPEQPANLAFGGSDGSTLFVTARTSLYAVPVQVTGAPWPPRRDPQPEAAGK